MSISDPPLPIVHKKPIQHAWAHRAYNWQDEECKVRTYQLPLTCLTTNGWKRCASNPVIPVGGFYDDAHAMHPTAIYRNGTTTLFYAGQQIADGFRRIMAATATDFKTFTKVAAPVFLPTDFGNALRTSVHIGNLLYDKVDDKYKFWGDVSGGGPANALGYAECLGASDPTVRLNWTCTPEIAYPAGRDYVMGVNRFGNMFHMIMGASPPDTTLYLITSPTGNSSFTDHGAILTVTALKWDSAHLQYSTIFWNKGIAYLFYSGSAATWATDKIGLATATNFITFGKWFTEDGQVFPVGAGGSWDANAVGGPSLIMHDGMFYMYYWGWNGVTIQIGLATVPTAI